MKSINSVFATNPKIITLGNEVYLETKEGLDFLHYLGGIPSKHINIENEKIVSFYDFVGEYIALHESDISLMKQKVREIFSIKFPDAEDFDVEVAVSEVDNEYGSFMKIAICNDYPLQTKEKDGWRWCFGDKENAGETTCQFFDIDGYEKFINSFDCLEDFAEEMEASYDLYFDDYE